MPIYRISLFSTLLLLFATNTYAQVSQTIIENAVFYDGYSKKVFDTLPAPLVRLRNDLVIRKITSEQLSKVYEDLTIKITIGARCDNYDRIGKVNLAFVPKNDTYTVQDSVKHIEIGRFITPFMQKNKDPKTVEYVFHANNVAQILNDKKLKEQYDFWLELEVFGVPYAANKEVQGCTGRNDVFDGKVEFISTYSPSTYAPNIELVPIGFGFSLNNYEPKHTDELGKTIKSFEFEVANEMKEATFYLITSNHGANEGGEEYIRREHFAYIDDQEVLKYIPGGKSCEPYRIHNTQGNGIYGRNPEPDSSWLAWNNWCPGDTISVREIHFSNLKPGKHTFRIEVPAAEFVEKQGYFPVSVYVQGIIGNRKSKKGKKTQKA